MNITFIGAGYVGLVTGTMMSYLGHNVTCLDTNLQRIGQLQKNIVPIYEPGLEKYIHQCTSAGRLRFTDKYDETLTKSSAIFIAVNTPSSSNGEANLTYIFDSITRMSNLLSRDCLVIVKSTVPPGTCNKIIEHLRRLNLSNYVATNPEFLREGSAIEDFLDPHRLVFGTDSPIAARILEEIYQPLISRNIKFIHTNLVTAELIKYSSNSFLAIKVAFINEMANLCEIVDADIEQLSLGMGLDDRIGQRFLQAGPGFGGSCFPKDMLALSSMARKIGAESKILEAAIEANNKRSYDMTDKISDILGGTLEGKNIAVLGLTYKSNTDDLRSSPAIRIIEIIESRGGSVRAYDPLGMPNVPLHGLNITCTENAEDACLDADALVIITEWNEFKDLNLKRVHNLLKSPIIIDLRNLLDPISVKDNGFKYFAIGKCNKE